MFSTDLQHTIVAQKPLIQDPAQALMRHICHPDAAYPKTITF
jgi:hypothetical protein